jgi:uncharacterized protein YegP (UPF0339 family)
VPKIFQDSHGEWRWAIFAECGKPVAVSPCGYPAKNDCVAALVWLKDHLPHFSPVH